VKSNEPNVIDIADQTLGLVEAAAFIRAAVGIPIERLDLERHGMACTGPVFCRWGRRRRPTLILAAPARRKP